MTGDVSVDLAVVGAGPAGANAALAAARHGLAVALLDEQPQAGGQAWRAKGPAILSAPKTPETLAGDDLRDALADSTATHVRDARVWQIERDDAGWVLRVLLDGRRTITVRARALVLAVGAREFVQPVPGWTTPGVVGLAGATALLKRELTPPGARTIVSGTGPLVFFAASEIRRLGGSVAAVVTPNGMGDWARSLRAMASRPDLLARGARWVADLKLARVPILCRHAVVRVHGGDAMTGADVQAVDATWAPVGTARRIDGDSLCLGNGLIPATEAAQLAGVALLHRPELGGWIPEQEEDGSTALPGLFVCGDGAGIRGAAAAVLHGRLAGLAAAAHLGTDVGDEGATLRPAFRRAARFGMAMTALSIPRAGLAALATDGTILCRCESLTRAAIAAEIGSGAHSAGAVKSGVRAGMGPCGGKFCQTAVSRLIAEVAGLTDAALPPATPRPPLRPVPIAAMAGDFDYADLPFPKPAPL